MLIFPFSSSFAATVSSSVLDTPPTQLFNLVLQTRVENTLSYAKAPSPPPTIGPIQYTYKHQENGP